MLKKYPRLERYIEEYKQAIVDSKNNKFSPSSFLFDRNWTLNINSIHKRLNNYIKDDFIILHELDEKNYKSTLTIRFPLYKEPFTIIAQLNYDGNKLAFTNIKEGSHIKYEDYLSGTVRPNTSGKNTHIFRIRQTEHQTIEKVIKEAISLAKLHFQKLLETNLKVKIYPNTTKVKTIEITEKNLTNIEKELDKAQESLIKAINVREIKNNLMFPVNGTIIKDYKLIENLNYTESIILKKRLEIDLALQDKSASIKPKRMKI